MNKKIILLRQKIEAVDRGIIEGLAKRQLLVKIIAQEKQKTHLNVSDRIRELELQRLRQELAHKYDLDLEFIEKIYQLIIRESRKIQKRI